MNRLVRVIMLALPVAALVTFGCARSKRQPTVVDPKPKQQPGPATPATDQGGGSQKYSAGDGDQGNALPGGTDSSSSTSTGPNANTTTTTTPSTTGGGSGSPGSGGGYPNGYNNSGYPNGNTNNGYPNGNTNSGYPNGNTNNGYPNGNTNNGYPNNNGTTDAEAQAHARRLGTWDAVTDRLPTGVRWSITDLDR